jgi:hypothetical protein
MVRRSKIHAAKRMASLPWAHALVGALVNN